VIERRRSGAMNAPWFFAHGDDAVAGSEGGCEVNVSHFGERVANGVVDGAFADFTAFDVRDGNAQGQGDGSRREHFVAVGDQEEKIGAKCAEMIGKAQRGDADCFGHTDVGVGAKQAFDTRRDWEAVLFDFANSDAEFGRKVCAEDNELQIDERVFGEGAERPI